MADIRIIQVATLEAVRLDWLLSPVTGLDQTQELVTAVIVALGTDRLASQDDVLPDKFDDPDRRGWWGDLDAATIWGGWQIGSRFWLLSRAKITDAAYKYGATVNNAQIYGTEALQPFIDNLICSTVEVSAQRVGVEEIQVQITLYRGPKSSIQLRFDGMWQELINLSRSGN